jgi:hypothetical protein
MLRIFYLALCH